jgi:serine/threonine protein kinase
MQQHTKDLNELEVDLLKGMVALDPNKRISAKMALLHPYFDSLEKSRLPYQYEEI